MILIDTGPLLALFDPRDSDHDACHKVLKTIEEPLYTTEAVLTEALYMIDAESKGAEGLKRFFLDDFVSLLALKKINLGRCFELMETYRDLPMDYGDASLVVLAEALGTTKIFTLDFGDFSVYRLKKGHKKFPFTLVGQEILQ